MLVIFDLDGTLVDNRKRLEPLGMTAEQFSQGLVPAELTSQKVEDTYLNPMKMLEDLPYSQVLWKLQYYINLRRLGKHQPVYSRIKIGILSNRPEAANGVSLLEVSKQWIAKQGVDLAELNFFVHRPADMQYDRKKCLDWKVAQVFSLRERLRLTTLAVYDDDMAVHVGLKDTDSERYLTKEGVIQLLP